MSRKPRKKGRPPLPKGLVPRHDPPRDAGFWRPGGHGSGPPGDEPTQHTFWGQNGAGILLSAGVAGSAVFALVTRAAPSAAGVVVLVILLLCGLYGVIAPYSGWWLPEPTRETQRTWRVGFVVLVLIVIVMFLRTETGVELTARLRSLFPTAADTSTPPLATRWPPIIAYGGVGDRRNHVVVDVGLINNANTAIGVSILTKAVVRAVPKNSDEEAAVVQALKDEIHARTAGVRAVTITLPAHDSSLRFVIPGPEVSQARRADIDAGREYVYFYALMQVRLGRASYPSTVCGRGSGTHVQQCAPELRRP